MLAGKLLWVAVKRRKQTPPPSAIGASSRTASSTNRDAWNWRSPPELAGSRNGHRRVLAGKLLWVVRLTATQRCLLPAPCCQFTGCQQTPPPSAIGEFAWRW